MLSSRNVTRRRVLGSFVDDVLSLQRSQECSSSVVLRNRVLFGVCTMYEHGSANLVTISPGLHMWVFLLRILTRCPACNAGSSGPARRSWSRIMRSLRCNSCSLISCWFCCISVGWSLASVVRIESESESESEIFIRSFQTQETSAKTITGRCRRGHLERKKSSM